MQDALAFRRALWSRTSASLWVHLRARTGMGECDGSGCMQQCRFAGILFGFVCLQASSANQADLDVGKERPAQRVGEVEHLAVVCARTRGGENVSPIPEDCGGSHLQRLGSRTISTVKKCTDAQEDGLTHRKKRYNDWEGQKRVSEGCMHIDALSLAPSPRTRMRTLRNEPRIAVSRLL